MGICIECKKPITLKRERGTRGRVKTFYCGERCRKKHYRHKDKRKERLKKYGLTPETFAEMLTSQGGKCAICRQPPKEFNLHVDHCHSTGRVRGLLCKRCNQHIGAFEDSPALLRRAAEYLDNSQLALPL